MRRHQQLVDSLSHAFLDGPWVERWLARRAAHDLEVELDEHRWLATLARRVIEGHARRPGGSPAARQAFTEFVRRQIDEMLTGPDNGQIHTWMFAAHDHSRQSGPVHTHCWPVPDIPTSRDLADRFNLDRSTLLWFADPGSFERTATDENLRHYNYRWIPKRSGGARLLEAPKQNLKYMQRAVLRDIVNRIPVHDAAHGFVAHRSIQTFAAPHTGRDWVLRLDLLDFFPSVSAGRIYATFRSARYRHDVAQLLAGLTTNATPPTVLSTAPGHRGGSVARNAARDSALRARLRTAHLPQGAPTSPALANLAAFGLDVRLAGLAQQFGARYTRYADDLAFSGMLSSSGGSQTSSAGSHASRSTVDRLIALAESIVRDEGFIVNPAKTQVRRAHQRQVLTGMVVNQRLNVHRRDLDRLRAELHQAVHEGPERANRNGHMHYRSHLQGKVGVVQATNPDKARKLWKLFDQINWT